ncbi:RNA polymerase sigma factor [Tannerella sp.]|uniref:RNA polymerase sigma factor n=1 Tax=Tannerella sp. TaxID=2382127 RepID=UPI0026DCCAB5|nr:RNA polymerase sigma factor [Tannerella sp.]MDO4702890.1 RNA polymerase sigma factor [Tannerella sp.]
MKKINDIASLYNLYVDNLYTYALYLGFDKEAIMDAIHDVFCKLAADEKTLRDVANIKSYLFKSLKNRLYDIFKAQREYVGLSIIESEEMPFDIHITIEDLLINREEQLQIERSIAEMLGSLTERQREIVYLRYIHEYDYEQIAELLQISVHGCRKLLSKAMQKLRNTYGLKTLLFIFV